MELVKTPQGNQSKKPFWKRRLSIVEAIYIDLVLDGVNYLTLDLSSRNDWTSFETDVFNEYVEKKDKYRNLLNSYFKDGWNLDRVNLMASAVLFEAVSEIHSKDTPVNVLIEQSVKTVRNYCGEDEYKMVNALLNNCLKHIGMSLGK